MFEDVRQRIDGEARARGRAPGKGVDFALEELSRGPMANLGDIESDKACERMVFVMKIPLGGKVVVKAHGGRDAGKTWTARESGETRASCLKPGEGQKISITSTANEGEREAVEFRVENEAGDVMMMRDEEVGADGKQRSRVWYAAMTLAANSEHSGELGIKFEPCMEVALSTAFSVNAGAERKVVHELFTKDGALLTKWSKHASGEKRMCLIQGRSYALRVAGAATYGTVEDRVAVRVTRALDDPKDGHAYLLARSEALFDEANHVYAAAQDETRDHMKLSGEFEFHVPNKCPQNKAEVSIVVESSTHGDGVPPHGMGWTMRDSTGKEVLTMTDPFGSWEYGVAKHHSVCVPEGSYEFHAIASDERGWNYGPKLGIYQQFDGEHRQLLVSRGGLEVAMRSAFTRPWFDHGMVSEAILFEVGRTARRSALGSWQASSDNRKGIAFAALGGVASEPSQTHGFSINSMTVLFACIAVYSLFALYRGFEDHDVESKVSLVAAEGNSAYGTGCAGPLDTDEEAARTRSKRKHVNPQQTKFIALAIGASVVSLMASIGSKKTSTSSLGLALEEESSTILLPENVGTCGMGITDCEKLYAPDCNSPYMFTYRQGKLAHSPKYILPYQSRVMRGMSGKVDVKFDPTVCAVRAKTCKDLGAFQGSTTTLSQCFDKCRETDDCKTFSVAQQSCQLCSEVDISPCTFDCDSVASRSNCMSKFKYSFVDVSPDECARACEDTDLCHGFNYFDNGSKEDSHCALLRLPAGHEAHVWRESTKTSGGIDGAATYFKTPSDRRCAVRGRAVASLSLPAGLAMPSQDEIASLALADGNYPDDAYPEDEYTDRNPNDSVIPWLDSRIPSPSQGPESTLPSSQPGSTSPSQGPESTLPSSQPGSTSPSQGPDYVLPSTYPSSVPVSTSPSQGPVSSQPGFTQWYKEIETKMEFTSFYTLESFDRQAQDAFKNVMSSLLNVDSSDIGIKNIEVVLPSQRRRLLATSTISFHLWVRVTPESDVQVIVDIINGWNDVLARDLQKSGLPVTSIDVVLEPVVQVYLPEDALHYVSSDYPSSGPVSTLPPSTSTPPSPTTPSATDSSVKARDTYNFNINIDVDIIISPQFAPFYDGCIGSNCDHDASTVPEATVISSGPDSSYPHDVTSTNADSTTTPDSDCVTPGSKTNLALYDELGSLENKALKAAQAYAIQTGLKVPDADMWVRPKICNLPHMKCCAELDWRFDNKIRFPFVCGSAPVGCHEHTYAEAKNKCVAEGGYLCRGNAVSTSMNDSTCPGSKSDFAWTLTRCDVNGVDGRIIRPSAGGAPGALCETNLEANHQTRCCSNVC